MASKLVLGVQDLPPLPCRRGTLNTGHGAGKGHSPGAEPAASLPAPAARSLGAASPGASLSWRLRLQGPAGHRGSLPGTSAFSQGGETTWQAGRAAKACTLASEHRAGLESCAGSRPLPAPLSSQSPPRAKWGGSLRRTEEGQRGLDGCWPPRALVQAGETEGAAGPAACSPGAQAAPRRGSPTCGGRWAGPRRQGCRLRSGVRPGPGAMLWARPWGEGS